MNQALYYQNMKNLLQFMNQRNPFQYIQIPMANPQANLLYKENQQVYLNINKSCNSIRLNNKIVVNFHSHKHHFQLHQFFLLKMM